LVGRIGIDPMELLGPNEFEPGTAAPISGRYELHHMLGNRTGEYVDLVIGQALPPAPRGWFWSVSCRGSEARPPIWQSGAKREAVV
jgi:hypothetical protein